MGNDLSIFVFAFVMAAFLMARLDRLGNQLEAVGVSIRAELARTEEERDQIINEWKRDQKQARRDAWQFWIFWSVGGAAGLVWMAIMRQS